MNVKNPTDLRAENSWMLAVWTAQTKQLRAENERLRSHIEKIVGKAQWYARSAKIQQEFADMARDALKTPPEDQ